MSEFVGCDVRIGWVPDPQGWEHWDEARALLETARAFDPEQNPILEDNYTVWAVLDGNDLLGCATARLTEVGDCEVILVAGRDSRRWIAELDRKIGAAAAEAGATHMTACGRAGWAKSLKALGWASEGEGRVRRYSRGL